MGKNLSLHKILLSLVAFVFLWTIVTDAWGYSDYFFYFKNGKYLYAYLSRLIWVLPAILLIAKYNNFLLLNKRKLFACLHLDKSLTMVMLASSLYVMINMLIYHQGFWFNSEVNLPLEIIKLALVGFVEETVFRGWGYNALVKVTSDKKAVLISTLFFVLVHWPAYFIKFYRFGTFDLSGILGQSTSPLIWGFVCCWLMKKSKSLWCPIIAHAVYDILYVLLIG